MKISEFIEGMKTDTYPSQQRAIEMITKMTPAEFKDFTERLDDCLASDNMLKTLFILGIILFIIFGILRYCV